MKKIALFDADGVLFNMWDPMKDMYQDYFSVSLSMQEWINVIRDFDANPLPYKDFGLYFMGSKTFSELPAMEGMPSLIKDMKNDGWELGIISASSPIDRFQTHREQNAALHYGDAFSTVHCIGSKDKDEMLRHYAKDYDIVAFCDDHPKNVARSTPVVTIPIWRENIPLSYRKDEMDFSRVHVASSADDIRSILSVGMAFQLAIPVRKAKSNDFMVEKDYSRD